MKASDIISRVSIALFDQTNVRWSKAEIVNYINDGQAQIILLRPDANAVVGSLRLATGTKQTLPTVGSTDPNGVPLPPGIRFLRMVRNMGSDGKTPGRAVRECSRVALDNEIPDWHTTNPGAVVMHHIFDNIAPKTFYVFPPVASTATVYAECIYAGTATSVSIDVNGVITNDTLTLDDTYINALFDFVMARCYAKDASYAGNMQRALTHAEAFGNALGVTQQLQFLAAAAQSATPTPAAAAQTRTG